MFGRGDGHPLARHRHAFGRDRGLMLGQDGVYPLARKCHALGLALSHMFGRDGGYPLARTWCRRGRNRRGLLDRNCGCRLARSGGRTGIREGYPIGPDGGNARERHRRNLLERHGDNPLVRERNPLGPDGRHLLDRDFALAFARRRQRNIRRGVGHLQRGGSFAIGGSFPFLEQRGQLFLRRRQAPRQHRHLRIDDRISADRADMVACQAAAGIAVMHEPFIAGDMFHQHHDVTGARRRHSRSW